MMSYPTDNGEPDDLFTEEELLGEIGDLCDDPDLFIEDETTIFEGEHDLEGLHYHGSRAVLQLVVEVIRRLPDHIRRWLLSETDHLFLSLDVQSMGWSGEHHLPEPARELCRVRRVVRIVMLSPALIHLPREDALGIIAHEIAHSFLGHGRRARGTDGDERMREVEATQFAVIWGLRPPRRGNGLD